MGDHFYEGQIVRFLVGRGDPLYNERAEIIHLYFSNRDTNDQIAEVRVLTKERGRSFTINILTQNLTPYY